MPDQQIMDANWLAFHADPKTPEFVVPNGAIDAHCHVFGPATDFPFSASRKYTPCDAGKEKLFGLRDQLGFSRNVIVQASCHGTNNDALVDALTSAGDLARGVAVVDPDISDSELKNLDTAGVRAVRFNFVKRLAESTPKSVFRGIAERVARLGWHVVVYFEAQDLEDLAPFLTSLPTPVVVDHMGRPDVSKPLNDSGFQGFISLMANRNIWTKVSCPERLTVAGPPYDDVIPFARALVDGFPDRVLWGTDWPHPNMKSHMPDDGALVDIIPRIAQTTDLQKALLVDNPMRLYWPEAGA